MVIINRSVAYVMSLFSTETSEKKKLNLRLSYWIEMIANLQRTLVDGIDI